MARPANIALKRLVQQVDYYPGFPFWPLSLKQCTPVAFELRPTFLPTDRRKSCQPHEKRAAPPSRQESQNTWARFCAILGPSTVPRSFFAIASPRRPVAVRTLT